MMKYEDWIKEVDWYLQQLFGEGFDCDWLRRVEELDVEIQAFYCINDNTLNKVLRIKRLLSRKRYPPRIPKSWLPERISELALKKWLR